MAKFDLTANEKEFLAAAARVDDPEDHVALYRAAQCKGHDKGDRSVRMRISHLLKREDAKAYFEAARMRHHSNAMRAREAADGAAYKEAQAKAELNQHIVQKLDAVLLKRATFLERNPDKTTADLARLAEIAHRVAGDTAGRQPLTGAERRQIREELRQHEQASEPRSEKAPVLIRMPAPATDDWKGGKA
jgi:hypothetical protein